MPTKEVSVDITMTMMIDKMIGRARLLKMTESTTKVTASITVKRIATPYLKSISPPLRLTPKPVTRRPNQANDM